MEIGGWAEDAGRARGVPEEANLARLGTIDEAGEPHVVPVWYAWDGERFLVGADAADHKVANLRRSGRASLEIDSDLRRKRGILVRGAATLIDGEAGRARSTARRARPRSAATSRTSRPPRWPTRMAARGTPVVIAITPRSIVSWGR